MIFVANVLAGLLGIAWLLSALRLRARAKAARTLPDSHEPCAEQYVFLVRPGVSLTEDAQRAASAYAHQEGLEVLDLIAPRLSAWRVGLLLHAVDPQSFRASRVATGYTAGDAMLVDRDVLARTRASEQDVATIDGFLRLSRTLKRHAVTRTDLVVAPGLTTRELTFPERRRAARIVHGRFVSLTALLQLGLLTTLFYFAPWISALALVVLHVKLLIATAGTALVPRDSLRYALMRIAVDALSVLGPVAPDSLVRPSKQELRATYSSLLASGLDSFFEPPREDCPLCGVRELTRMLESGDTLQRKPGRFVLTRCTACGHIFQNPRLTVAGLDFYYRDAYDGLGGQMFDDLFKLQTKDFERRVAMVRAYASPATWLDVGAGHGHFCCYASGLLPETKFDGLDLNEGIEEAERRRWVRRALRGLFPQVATTLSAQRESYDVVSMSHYLEHTLDPRAEIDAASAVVREGGLLMIEVPDPESRIGRFFKSLWLPWMQPQHLHFVSSRNLDTLLRERSFEPLEWHRGAAHMPHDFTFIAVIAVGRLALPGEHPWLPPHGILRRLWHSTIWAALAPVIALAWLLDQLVQPLMRRPGWSNTYRVLARRNTTDRGDKHADDTSHVCNERT